MACVVGGCKSHSSRKENNSEGLSFHRFSKDDEKKYEWMNRTGQQNWTVKRHSHICSKHFTPDSFTCSTILKWRHLKEYAVPTLFIMDGIGEMRYYEFTQDEIKALEECDKESFYQRCLPFSTLFATATYTAIRYGFLRRNPHFGVMPKVMIAAIIGYFYGRLSYIQDCDVKLRKLPKASHLGNTMRKYYAERNPPACPKK